MAGEERDYLVDAGLAASYPMIRAAAAAAGSGEKVTTIIRGWAVAVDGHLGHDEIAVLGWLGDSFAARYRSVIAEGGRPEVYELSTTYYAALQAMGRDPHSGREMAWLETALKNLMAVVLTIPGIDPETGVWRERLRTQVHVLSWVQDERGQGLTPAEIGALRQGAGEGPLRIRLERWLMDSLLSAQFSPVRVKPAIQSALTRRPRAVWLWLEANRAPMPTTHFARVDGQRERLSLPLTPETLSLLGFNYKRQDRSRSALAEALEAIAAADPRYRAGRDGESSIAITEHGPHRRARTYTLDVIRFIERPTITAADLELQLKLDLHLEGGTADRSLDKSVGTRSPEAEESPM